ncbi:MAG: isoprenylcysteine carboxylmethyltransferase family protein [Nitrospiraceae bacterium]|nr:MAG: isoprenylcysteine carboxylmethyltransferase family protein [Nitrospiraceae bacterium]
MDLIRNNRIMLSRIFTGALFIVLFTTTHSWESGSPVDITIEFIGLALIIIGSYGRIWSYLYICGRKTDELVIIGPYSITRNPLYFFSLIGAIGVGFASENILVVGLIILFFIIIYPVIISAEEKKLEELHGDAFRDYRNSVPRLFPKTFTLQHPELYEIYTRKFGRVFFDAMWFVWLFIIMQVIEKLHNFKIIPVLWQVP